MIRAVLPVALVLVLATAGTWYGRLRREESGLRDAVARLREQHESLRALSNQVAAWRGLAPDPVELEHLENRRLALLRLRGEIGDLRRLAKDAGSADTGRVAEARAEAGQAREETRRLRERVEADARSRAVLESLNQASVLVHEAVRRAEGAPPTSWEEVEQRLSGPWKPFQAERPERPETAAALRAMHLDSLEQARRNAVPLETFEFVPAPVTGPAGGSVPPGADPRGRILLRERQPRAHPGGGWRRAYALADGRVEEATSPDGRFEEWERAAAGP